MKYWLLLLCLALLLVLAGCQQAETGDDAGPRGEILFWYPQNEATDEVWAAVLDRFREIYPNVRVITNVVAEEEMVERYVNSAAMGLGPDLLVAPAGATLELAEQELIHPLDGEEMDLSNYLSTAVEALSVGGRVYGLPLFLTHNALYYNRELVEQPAQTLSELLAAAEAGQQVAIPTSFSESFWGTQAFGGEAFDEEGRVVLATGGLANWLAWLKNAQDTPGMILHEDETTLQRLFTEGDVAYYVGGSDELATLREALGEELVGVALLPAGPEGPAGPLLEVDGLMFNAYSSDSQFELALILGRFLSNAEQAALFMRDAQRVPANTTARVDPRINPAIAAFSSQARTAVVLPNRPQSERLRELGNDLYRSVLAGVTVPAEAVLALTNTINQEFGFEGVAFGGGAECPASGELLLWHTWNGRQEQVLSDMAFGFGTLCPGVTVQLQQVAVEDLPAELANAEEPPDLLLVASPLVESLVSAELVVPITGEIAPELRQRYIPNSLEALSYEQELYGLPVALKLNTFYYNRELVGDPVATAEELRLQAQAGRQIAIPATAVDAFWGMTAFSGNIVTEEGRLFPNVEGLIAWLQWLQEIEALNNVQVSQDPAALRELFATDGIHYYVGRAEALSALEDALGSTLVRNALLPSGPAGEARPLLFVDALLFPAAERLESALALAIYLTNGENQTELMARASMVPANVNVSIADFPLVEVLQRQAQNAFLSPPAFPLDEALPLADEMYAAVLEGEQTPTEAACDFVVAVNQVNGRQLSLEEVGEVCTAEAESESGGDE